jgi:hypothetical protein
MQTESRAAIIKGKAKTMELTLQSNLLRNNKTETAHSDAVQNDSAANINTNTTVLWIIIDFPSYFIIF